MATEYLLGANMALSTHRQAVAKNQVIRMNGFGDDKFVVYDIANTDNRLLYKLINIRTKTFAQSDLIRPLSQKFGIGYYFDDETPEFLGNFQVALLQNQAELLAKKAQIEQEEQERRNEQLTATGRERLEKLVPADTKGVIVAKLCEDESDMMTDYFGYRTVRTVILGFSAHTRDLFSEMRKYAVNFSETAHLAEDNAKYEHREKYTGGSGYYLGKHRNSGWVVRKEKYFQDRASIINAFALTAGDEENIRVKEKTQAKPTPTATTISTTGNFLIVDYSAKALAVFGDTRPIKEQLQALGGRFNPRLTHNEQKQAGWIFSKAKEQEIKNLLNI